MPEDGEPVLADDVWALDQAGLIDASWNYAFDPEARFIISASGEARYDTHLAQRNDATDASGGRSGGTGLYGEPELRAPSFFISYSHKDKPLAVALKTALVARGCAAWRDEDELRAGDSLAARVADAVHEFEFMAVLVSDASRNSHWVEKELSLATTRGLNDGRVKVMPLRVDETEMPRVIADLVYVPIAEATVESAADRLVRDARRLTADDTEPPYKPPARARTPNASQPPEFDFEPLKILGVVAEGMGRPRNDGTRGSALYAVPLRLSRTPTPAESNLLREVWDHPPRFTTLHRPGIAQVQGDRFVLDGTTIEEIESHHAETLRHVLIEVNRRAAEVAQREHESRLAQFHAEREHAERVERARRLRFD
jgi:TIR domain